MDIDGGRNLLARLIIVYSGAIGASENHTLSSRNVETPTDTFHSTITQYTIISVQGDSKITTFVTSD